MKHVFFNLKRRIVVLSLVLTMTMSCFSFSFYSCTSSSLTLTSRPHSYHTTRSVLAFTASTRARRTATTALETATARSISRLGRFQGRYHDLAVSRPLLLPLPPPSASSTRLSSSARIPSIPLEDSIDLYGDDDDAKLTTTTTTTTTTTGLAITGRIATVELNVTVLDRGLHHIVVEKPPGVFCHHSDWSGSRRRINHQHHRYDDRKNNTIRMEKREGRGDHEAGPVEDSIVDIDDCKNTIPMLQRTREAVKSRVNLIHRLDRGASGCLLLTYADTGNINDSNNDDETIVTNNATAILQQAMTTKLSSSSSSDDDDDIDIHEDIDGSSTSTNCASQKTYLAFVRGECIVHGQDLRELGWFKVDRPIRNEKGVLKNATTYFRWIAGQDNDNGRLAQERPRASIVLARPITGRWHQIRKHLNGLSAPIIGDSSHGNSKTNREWRRQWGLPPERTCLHLLNIQLTPNQATPSGLNVSCPLLPDMQQMLAHHILPDVVEDAKMALKEEGLNPSLLDGKYNTDDAECSNFEVITINFPIELQ